MPIKNGSEYFNKSYGSIINQTYTDWQLYVGLNGFAFNEHPAWDYITDTKKTHIFNLEHCHSKSEALNELIIKVDTEYTCLLDVDDYWNSEKLEEQVKLFNDLDLVHVCGTQGFYFGEKDKQIDVPSGYITDSYFHYTNPIINSSCMVRTHTLQEWLWHEEWDGVEDYDLWLRLWREGFTFYNSPKTLVFHRLYKESAYNNKNDEIAKKLRRYHFG